MRKSELIENLVERFNDLPVRDIERVVKSILEHMTESLEAGNRIEIRGFGSFSLHHRTPRMGRNPKTGEAVPLAAKRVPHFKPGKDLRDQVDANASK
jgi:integration host factor subunit beta